MILKPILRLHDYNIKSESCNYHIIMALKFLSFLNASFIKYIVIFISSLVKNFLI